MPLPKVLTSLGAAEQTAARSFANVKTAVDPLLQLCNSTFQVANDGTLGFLRKIKTFSAQTLNATTSNVTTANNTTTNTSGTASAATSTATSMVSSTGFKFCGPMNTYSGSPAGGGFYNCAAGVTGSGAFAIPFAGSLVGVCINFNSPTVTTTYRFYTTGAWGDSFVLYNNTGAQSGATLYAAYPKGQYPFGAGAVFICKVYSSATSGAMSVNIVPVFELGA